VLLLFGNNVRLIIENYQKYGILISLPGSKVSKEDWILTGLAHLLVPLNVILSYQLERWAMKRAVGHRKRLAELSSLSPSHGHTNGDNDEKDPKQVLKDLNKAETSIRRTQKIFGWLHAFSVIAILAWPSYMSYYMIFHPFMSITCLMNGTIQFLKMTSYSLTNQDLRAGFIYDLPPEKFQHTRRVHDAASNTFVSHQEVYEYEVNYPDNITFKDMAYFWFAPTLCYQPSYPRTTVFRKSFFLKRVLEALTCLGMMYFLIEQYATPTLQNSVRAVDQLAFGTMLERILKLSTTSVLIWLLMFYTFFHAVFNGIAEVCSRSKEKSVEWMEGVLVNFTALVTNSVWYLLYHPKSYRCCTLVIAGFIWHGGMLDQWGGTGPSGTDRCISSSSDTSTFPW
jgi:diacylglycerol O-acyltransferase-1